jgi:hypothetical protein
MMMKHDARTGGVGWLGWILEY